MKINIAAPSTGLQKVIEIDDEKRLQNLYERRMAQEIDGATLGEEFAGYLFRISGGNDKQDSQCVRAFLPTPVFGSCARRDTRRTVPVGPERGRERVSVDALLELISPF